MVMDLASDTFMKRYLTNLDSPFLRYFSKTESRNQGHVDSKTVFDTLCPQDVSTTQIWDSYVKCYGMYARDTICLDLRAEIKVRDAPRHQDALTHEFWHSSLWDI